MLFFCSFFFLLNSSFLRYFRNCSKKNFIAFFEQQQCQIENFKNICMCAHVFFSPNCFWFNQFRIIFQLKPLFSLNSFDNEYGIAMCFSNSAIWYQMNMLLGVMEREEKWNATILWIVIILFEYAQKCVRWKDCGCVLFLMIIGLRFWLHAVLSGLRLGSCQTVACCD